LLRLSFSAANNYTEDLILVLCSYVRNFPKDQKYISVLKTEDKAKVEKMRELMEQRKKDQAEKEEERRRKEALGSEDEDLGADEDEDDFFEAAEEEPAAEAADDDEKVDEPAKRKRDKRLPDRNRKAKKQKQAA